MLGSPLQAMPNLSVSPATSPSPGLAVLRDLSTDHRPYLGWKAMGFFHVFRRYNLLFCGEKGWNEATAHIEFYLQERDLTDVKQCRLGAVAKQNSGVCLPKVGKNKAAATTVCDLHMNMNLLSSLFFFLWESAISPYKLMGKLFVS